MRTQEGEEKMLIEDKVQIEAVKTRSYMMGEIDGKVMITQGRYIVFVKKEDFLLDIDKQKKLPEDGVKHFPQKIFRAK